MKSAKLGKNISEVEVQNVSQHGIWLYAQGREYFLSFKDYPWFENSNIADVCTVELLGDNHLHWPALDIDLELESLEQPGNYPLIYK